LGNKGFGLVRLNHLKERTALQKFAMLSGKTRLGNRPRTSAFLHLDRVLAFLFPLMAGVSPPSNMGITANFYLRAPNGTVISVLDLGIAPLLIYVLLQRIRTPKGETLWIYLSLVLVTLSRAISVLNSDLPEMCNIFSVLRYLEVLAIIHVAMVFSERPETRKALLMGLLLGVLIESVGATIVASSTGRCILLSHTQQRFQAFLFIYCMLVQARGASKVVYWLCAVLIVIGMLASGTRSVFLIGLASLALGLILLGQGSTIARMALLLPVAACLVYAFPQSRALADSFVYRLKLLADYEGGGSTNQRLYLWSQAMALFLQKPLTGIGSGVFGRFEDLRFELPSWLNIRYSGEAGGLGTHSTFMGVLAETGIIGIVAYSFWFLGIWKLFSKSLKVVRNGFNVPLVTALSTFILLSTVSDIVHVGSFENGHSLLVGVLIGLLREYDSKFNRMQTQPMFKNRIHYRVKPLGRMPSGQVSSRF